MLARLTLSAVALSMLAGATTGAATNGAQAATTGDVVSIPAAVAADCSTNVTRQINSWLASVPDGATALFGRQACYRVDGTLLLRDRRDLTVDGNGALFRAVALPPTEPKITRQMLLVQGGARLVVRNMRLQGTNPSPVFDVRREWFPLIELAGPQDVLVDKVTGSNSWGDFVFVTPDVRKVVNSDGTGAVLPQRITVQNSTGRVIGRHAIACNGCENLTVAHNSFSDIGYQVLDIEVEASTWHARDVTFSSNTMSGRIALSVLASGDNVGHDITRVVVADNTMLTSGISCAPPIDVYETTTLRSDFDIVRNQFKTLSNAVRIAGVSGADVSDNTVNVGEAGCTNSRVAVVARNLTSAVLRNNYFPGATRLVVASGVMEGTFCGNKLTSTGPPRPVACV